MKKIKIKVLSKQAIQTFKTNDKHIVISVRDPGSSRAKLFDQISRVDSLFLAFSDIEDTRHFEDIEIQKKAGIPFEIFTEAMSVLVWKFINRHLPNIDLIVVNCEAGISRSAGIAPAISKVLDGDDEYFFKHYLPNSLVYNKILKEGMKHVKVQNQ